MMNTFFSRYLPDPLRRPDGTRVTRPEDWATHRAYLKSLAETYLYGPWPGRPEQVTGELLTSEVIYGGKGLRETYLLTYVYQGTPYTLNLSLIRPHDQARHPAIIANCISYDPAFRFRNQCEEEMLDRGYLYAMYPMGQLVWDPTQLKYFDLPDESQRPKPRLACATIMTWGWGHTIAADFLTQLPCTGPLICTGGSRGGKAALCAGIFDERFAIVAPFIAGCGGTGSARFCGTADGARQDSERCETIGRINASFPDWFTAAYRAFGAAEEPYPIGDEVNAFPLDANVLRAMVAPRAVFSTDGEEDGWSNPFGTQLGWMAAQPVFDLLGVPQRNGFHIRPGVHTFDPVDTLAILDFCDLMLGKPLPAPHEDLNKPYFDIDIRAYAPWMA